MNLFRVIFLDIDGVLNHRAFFHDRPDNKLEICPAAAARVQRICDESCASLVISSTWRLLHRKLALQSMFARRGISTRIAGMTPAIPTGVRGDEIQAYLNAANLLPEPMRPEGIVILDDDADMAHLAPWLVQTTFETGLTDEHMDRAIEMLRQPPPRVLKAAPKRSEDK